MNFEQAANRERAIFVVTEHRRLSGELRRLEKTIQAAEAEEARARQRGRDEEVIKLAEERESLKISRRTTQVAFAEIWQQREAIRDEIRQEIERSRSNRRWPWW